MGVNIGVIHQKPLCRVMGFMSVTRRMLSVVVLMFLLLLLLASTLQISSPTIRVDGWKNGAGVPSNAPVCFLVNAEPSTSAEENNNLAHRRKAAAAPAATAARPLRNRNTGDSPVADEYSPDYARKVREASGESDVSVSPLGYRMGETLPVTVYVRTERRTSHFLSFTTEYDGEVLEMETKKPKWEDPPEEDVEEKDGDEEEEDKEEEDAVVDTETDLEEEEALEKNQRKYREASWSRKKKAKSAPADNSEDHSENPSSVVEKEEGSLEAAVSDVDRDNGIEASSSFVSSSSSSKKKKRKVSAEMMSTTAASPSPPPLSSSSETEGDVAVPPLPIKKKRRRSKKSRRPISSPTPHITTTTLIPLSQDSNVEMELRLASSMRQSKNQLVRNIPTALSPRMGVNHQVRIPVLTWMTQAAASMQNDRRTGSDNDKQEMESTLAFRFSVSGHGRKKETTWFPLVSRVRQDGFHVEHEARLDYAEHKGRTTRAEADSVAAELGKQGREDGGHHSDSSEAEAEEYPMRYLSGLTFYFGFRSGVFNTITSLSMRAYYSETLTRELVVQYQWDEHRPYNSHYGITLVSVCSVTCSAVMLYVILGGPPVEDIVRYFFCGFFFKHRRLRRSGASRKANRVSAKFYDIVEAVHHHED